MAGEKLRNIRKHLFRKGRYLDVARWNYHFEEGPAEEVLKALYSYQNQDGGFAYGLEPDNQSPYSTPAATFFAVEILRELDFPDLAKGMIDRITKYLMETPYFDGLRWRAAVSEKDEYPHAPWWESKEDKSFGYNPTAGLIGFLLRTAPQDSKAYFAAVKALDKMVAVILKADYEPERHELSCFVSLEEDLEQAGLQKLLPKEFYEKMGCWIYHAIDQKPDQYKANLYYRAPDAYIKDKDSKYYEKNREICRFYVEYIEESFGEEGIWPVNWTWGEEEIPQDVLRDWQGSLAVSKMLFIQKMK